MGHSDDVNVAIIGYGLAGAVFHAPLIAATPGLRVGAIVTRDAERSRSAREAFPEAHVFPAVEQLWEMAREVELVVIASPNRTHVPLAERALSSGLGVVVDKPLAPTPDAGRRLTELAEREGRVLTVYQNRRWDGDFMTVRRLIAEGELGEVARFESRFDRWRPVPKPGWRQLPSPEDAGGLLYDLGAHLIDQALLLFGRVTEVYAELDRRGSGSEVDNDTFLALTHVGGVRSHLWMSTHAGQSGARFRVLGSRAAYVKHGLDPQEAALRSGARLDSAGWGEEDPEFWGTLGAGGEVRRVRTENGAYPAFYGQLLKAIRGGAQPPVDPADSVAGLEIITAAQRSARERTVVQL